MTEMDITYIFIRYMSVTINRQSKTFYRKWNKIIYYENEEFIENMDVENQLIENPFRLSSTIFSSFEEVLSYQEMLLTSLSSLNEMEKQIVCEKFINLRSDADIGRDFCISGQMISKRKRAILEKLKNFSFI